MRAVIKTIDGSVHTVEEADFIFEGYKKLEGALFTEGNAIDTFDDDDGRITGIVNMQHVSAIKFEY
ncbi:MULTISPECIES: hypothetical protein [Bacillus]|uniref:Phage protein n=1 Tax=Bacillus cereus (strain ATCC 14579 / DSM 31 / CCUG 7414 / JCM 2152 / NBRC 15305 / NCIMB 9373 / NCTC 2599 / NRRL B-3711) TaxID=226900 RepID=Q81ET2_BACCR|nr:hypothetical protein [Bacillus cereus]NP_852516.1 hypothetical protein BC1882 [Bacillus phage phBC6A51]AAP08856.1 Phage protein [Bacillus cereus ATCC 14579]EEL11991.1 hypothetical protein bcere0015_17690 [Bacillus cereus BDRD-Cer4]MCC3287383.1 hypothetical protein [Bacillus cereus]MEB9996628.1 hypothetical protein [Bacillus cereus]OOR46627.1 hypothetical protein BW896_08055 [Bacillus cereus]